MKDSLGTAQGLLAHRAAPAFVHALNHLTESLGHHSWLVPPGKDLAGGLLHSLLSLCGDSDTTGDGTGVTRL